MRLTKRQRERVLEWIAEGLQSDEINARAARCRPAFQVDRQQVDHYRKTRGVVIDELRDEGELAAVATGLATAEGRVEALAEIAELLRAELVAAGSAGRLWLPRKKMLGRGDDAQTITQYEFNAAGIGALRGLLDDIAKETGDRTYARFDDAEGDDVPTADPATSAPAKLEIEIRYVDAPPLVDDDGADSARASETSLGPTADQEGSAPV